MLSSQPRIDFEWDGKGGAGAAMAASASDGLDGHAHGAMKSSNHHGLLRKSIGFSCHTLKFPRMSETYQATLQKNE